MMNRKTGSFWIVTALLAASSLTSQAAPPTEGWVNSRLINGAIVKGGPIPVWQAPDAAERPTHQDAPPLWHETAKSSERPSSTGGEGQNASGTSARAPAGGASVTTAPALPPPTSSLEPQSALKGEMKAALTVAAGERLSGALVRFLQANGLHLQWSARSDFVARHGYSIAGTSIDETLAAALSPHGLSSTLWESNRVLEVHARSAEVRP
jgi:hypothetical protein